jgi:hypothetical protein
MDQRSENFPLVLLAGGLLLALFAHHLFGVFLDEWIKLQLEHIVGLSAADIIEKSGALLVQLFVAFGIVWILYNYIERHLRREFEFKFADRFKSRAKFRVDNPYVVNSVGADRGSCRVRVHNDGASANRVHMHLRSISREAKSGFLSDFPYRVIQPGLTQDSNDCEIHEGSSAEFEITKVWTAAHNKGFLTTLNTKEIGIRQGLIESGEEWEMKYDVTSENSDLLPFSLRMSCDSNGIIFTMI